MSSGLALDFIRVDGGEKPAGNERAEGRVKPAPGWLQKNQYAHCNARVFVFLRRTFHPMGGRFFFSNVTRSIFLRNLQATTH